MNHVKKAKIMLEELIPILKDIGLNAHYENRQVYEILTGKLTKKKKFEIHYIGNFYRFYTVSRYGERNYYKDFKSSEKLLEKILVQSTGQTKTLEYLQ